MNERTGISREIWLLMAKEGGRWSTAELTEKTTYDRMGMAGCIASMVRGGILRQFDAPAGKRHRYEFGVTAACRVPQGVTLADLVGAEVVAEAA